MPLASTLLALFLGQSCPTPSTQFGPPPCAAANVPGCLPGYAPRWDERLGKVVYACTANSRQVIAIAYPQRPAAPPPAAAPVAPAQQVEARGHLGLVFMPGVSAPSGTLLERAGRSMGQLALEIRGSDGGGRLRFSGTWASFGKIGEVSVKYDFLDPFFLRPFLAVGLGVASINPDPGIRGAASASGGLDLFVTRNFFMTAEINGRVFTSGTQGPAHGLVLADQRQLSFLVGLGFFVM